MECDTAQNAIDDSLQSDISFLRALKKELRKGGAQILRNISI
jgi:hypothetical protein